MASRGRRNERENETPRKTTTWVQKKQSPLLKLRANLEKGTVNIDAAGHEEQLSERIHQTMLGNLQLPPKPPKRFEGFTPHSYHMQPHQTRSLADLYDLEFREGDLSRAKEWVQSGGDIDHRFSKGRTLLHYA
eukprot:CAMPEP_0117895626 /NCGR_PEP_ID=MMETSP0950-20121206/26770_1 /TAXON_ID=44440 /ORGANISM="Chattonella subsalsa, Strain CCMP2191" /LENGTH=132 /DNA_ID=CAMNT_0005756585 /DNA_START=198 /DNA_END=594 /DNA_ORIENTATION=+